MQLRRAGRTKMTALLAGVTISQVFEIFVLSIGLGMLSSYFWRTKCRSSSR